jgi:hypothetical protein
MRGATGQIPAKPAAQGLPKTKWARFGMEISGDLSTKCRFSALLNSGNPPSTGANSLYLTIEDAVFPRREMVRDKKMGIFACQACQKEGPHAWFA